jgi:cytochrome c-type biogenesis protein CcmH
MNDTAHKLRFKWTTAAIVVAIAIVIVAIYLKSRDTVVETVLPLPKTGQAPVNDSIAKLQKQLRADPSNVDGWHILGWSYLQLGRFNEAVDAYERAVSIDPKQADLWSSLGEAVVLAGNAGVTDDALRDFHKAIAIDPTDLRARFFIGAAKGERGNPNGAIDEWMTLLRSSPPNAPWIASVRQKIEEVGRANHINVAARLSELPKPVGSPEAMARRMVDSLTAKLRADPKHPDGWIMLMRSQMVLGDTKGAIGALEDARAAYADNAAQRDAFTRIAQKLGVPEH